MSGVYTVLPETPVMISRVRSRPRRGFTVGALPYSERHRPGVIIGNCHRHPPPRGRLNLRYLLTSEGNRDSVLIGGM